MSKDVNLCIFTGTIGRDCEIRYAANGTAFTSFSMANNRDYKDKAGQEHKKTVWLNVVMVGKRGEAVAKFLKKGARVLVQGEYQERQWEKDGTKHKAVEICIDMGGDIQILKFPDEGKAGQVPPAHEYDSNPPGRPGGSPERGLTPRGEDRAAGRPTPDDPSLLF